MFCPNCKEEYQEGFNTCADCMVPLVSELPKKPLSQLEELAQSSLAESADNEPILLTLVNSEMECRLIHGFLEQEGIPALIIYRGADAYLNIYMGQGNNIQPIEIHVPKNALEKALNLLETFHNDESLPLDENNALDVEEERKVKGRRARIFLFCVFIAPIIFLLLCLLISRQYGV